MREHSGCGLGQWETALHCNASSHWLSPYRICTRFCIILICFVVAMFMVLDHDDVIKWKFFPRHWSFVRENPLVTSVFFMCVWTNGRTIWFETPWYPCDVTAIELMRLIYSYHPKLFLLAPEQLLDWPKISKETPQIWIKSTSSTAKQTKTKFETYACQGSFFVWVQPMIDVISRRLSYAEPIYKMIPTYFLETTARPALWIVLFINVFWATFY